MAKKQKTFFIKNRKLYVRDDSGKSQLVGSAIRVTAFGEIRGSKSGSFAEIRLLDYDHKARRIHVPRRDFVSQNSTLALLLDKKYQVPTNKELRRALHEYISSSNPKGRRIITASTGWVKKRFVLPNAVIGQSDDDKLKIVYRPPEGPGAPQFGRRGTLEEWKGGVAVPATGSPLLIFCICLALAAPLLDLCGEEGGGIHMFGPSSKGKTLSLLVARSVSGKATRGDLKPWRTTSNALEAIAFAHNDTLLCIDDTDQLPNDAKSHAQTIREAAHTLANGKGKLRLSAFGAGVAVDLTWKILVLSNGVKPLAEIVKGGGTERMGSEEVRLSDLPCVLSEETGVFKEFPHEVRSLEAAIRLIEDGCKQFYGAPLRSFLQHVVPNQTKIRIGVHGLMRKFIKAALVTESDAWEQRFAKKFALAFAAGILAARQKILPWTETQIEAAVLDCYARARKAVLTAEELERCGLGRLEKFSHDPAKIVRLHKIKKRSRRTFVPKPGRAVIDKNDKHGLHLIISPKRFEKWMGAAQVAQLTLQALDRAGRLIRTEQRVATSQRMFPWEKKRRRYYVIAIKKSDLAKRRSKKSTAGA